MSEPKQKDADWFVAWDYTSKERWASYYHQLDGICQKRPSNVLEVGAGNGIVAALLRHMGFYCITCDILPSLRPSVAGSVVALPFRSHSFEMVSCCEVLEHLPYDLFRTALGELQRVSQRWVQISLPDSRRAYPVSITLPKLGHFSKILSPPRYLQGREKLCDEHYWEIGCPLYSIERVVLDLRASGFQIVRSYRVPEIPYHHFFILEKSTLSANHANDSSLQNK